MILDKKMLTNQVVTWKERPVTDDPKKPRVGAMVPCAVCNKIFQVPMYKGVMDPICAECFKTYHDTAVLICRRCNVVVGRIVSKMLDCGFYVKPRMTLHTDKCGICDESVKESTIIEVDQWMKHNRRPTVYTASGSVYRKGEK